MSRNDNGERPYVVVTLGDGDFSYSYDLGRYLQAKQEEFEKADDSMVAKQTIRLIATGFDSLDDLKNKYKDTPFLLDRLEKLGQKMMVSTLHNINAMEAPTTSVTSDHVDVVLFNHPHLGTENARMHSRFLCHLFHSVSQYWLSRKSNSYFILTLVKGQYERWKCHDAAERHQMKLIQQFPFIPPPVEDPYFQHRRHQSGKSFAARAPLGSETFVFRNDINTTSCQPTAKDPFFLLFDWHGKSKSQSCSSVSSFQCPFCEKSFREERSRKNHIVCVHPKGSKRERDDDDDRPPPVYTCHLCPGSTNLLEPYKKRVFQTLQGLQDHMRNKHSGIHTEIPPDWLRESKNNSSSQDDPRFVSKAEANILCPICNMKITSQEDHKKDFLPIDENVMTEESKKGFQCSFCPKKFRQLRAQQQHENNCAVRLRGDANDPIITTQRTPLQS